jgi:UDP-N-acetyl-D-mannosaminuronic acid dehydrogenase
MSVSLLFGLGRTGIPQALVAAESGLTVYGIERSKQVVAGLLAGETTFYEPGLEELLRAQLRRGFFPMIEDELPTVAADADWAVVAIGLPQRKDNRLSPRAMKALTNIADALLGGPHKDGVTIIIRCAMPVGSTDFVRDHVKRVHGLVESKDYFLAAVPERLAEGNAVAEERGLPRMIGTYTDEGFERVSAYFKGYAGALRRLSSPSAAEFAKLADNSYRDLHFAFANELAYVADAAGLDATEVINACNADYPRNAIPLPGPVSGYCLSKDPWILNTAFTHSPDRARTTSLFASGRRVHEELTIRATATLAGMLPDDKAAPRIAILGLSFKEDVDDFRSSHPVAMIQRLRDQLPDARFVLYDPGLEKSIYTRLPAGLSDVVEASSTELTPELLDGVDGVLIATRHAAIREAGAEGGVDSPNGVRALLAKAARPVAIYDCWNVWRAAEAIDGVRYRALGKGVPVGS